MDYVVAIEAVRGAGQDRAEVVSLADGIVVALADGAGGTSHGERAAEAVCAAARGATEPLVLLRELDRASPAGETTAVVIVIQGDVLRGASVGDSGAWLIGAREVLDLTEGQQRKPLLGAGARPVAFECAFTSETLLVASDGLLRYAKQADIARLAQLESLEQAAAALIELVRLPTGGLQDDVSIVLCRRG